MCLGLTLSFISFSHELFFSPKRTNCTKVRSMDLKARSDNISPKCVQNLNPSFIILTLLYYLLDINRNDSKTSSPTSNVNLVDLMRSVSGRFRSKMLYRS